MIKKGCTVHRSPWQDYRCSSRWDDFLFFCFLIYHRHAGVNAVTLYNRTAAPASSEQHVFSTTFYISY